MAIYLNRNPRYVSQRRLPTSLRGDRGPDLRTAVAAGGAISNLGRELQRRGAEIQQERDATVVADFYNQWRDQERAKISELFQRKGFNATNLGQEYDSFFNDSVGFQFENSNQQQAFQQAVERRREQSLDVLARYQVQEAGRYKAQQYNLRVSNAEQEIRDNPFSDQDVDETLAELHDWIDMAHPGEPEHAQLLKDKEEARLRFAQVQSQMDIDASLAMTTLERYKDKLGEGYNKLLQSAKPKVKAQLIDNIQSELQRKYETGGIPDFAKMRQELTHTEAPADVKFEVRSWIDAYETGHTEQQKTLQKEAHDKEEREIGEAFLEGNYVQVKNLLRKSQYLSGDELKTWANAIKSQGGEENYDKELVDIAARNQEWSRGEDINLVVNRTIQSPYISQSKKKEMIDRFYRQRSAEVDQGQRRGYNIIYSMLIPGRGEETVGIRTGLDRERAILGQQQLDDWVQAEEKRGKPPTKKEIENKAIEIANSVRPTYDESIEWLDMQNQLSDETLKKLRESTSAN